MPTGGAFPEGMAAAELAVHTYDLATALGRATADLDPEVAEEGRAFMTSSMTDEMRGDAFGPEQPAPADADAYQRIAAFAGHPSEHRTLVVDGSMRRRGAGSTEVHSAWAGVTRLATAVDLDADRGHGSSITCSTTSGRSALPYR